MVTFVAFLIAGMSFFFGHTFAYYQAKLDADQSIRIIRNCNEIIYSGQASKHRCKPIAE